MEISSKCDLCTEDFISPAEFNHHMSLKHGKPSCKPKKSFICSMCDHVFGRKEHLVRHMRTHTGERPFKCTVDDCGKTFKLESALKDHNKFKHNEDRPLKCHFPGCRYAAKTSTNLNRHNRVHIDERPFACSQCDYKTSRSDFLKLHRMRRHSARRDFKCSHAQCIQSFKTLDDLQRHFSNQHNEKNVACDHPGCDQKYANASALKKHKKETHSTKSLVCPTVNCSYRTTRSRDLARHLVVHDRGNEKTPCSIEGCQYKGKNQQALEKRARVIHKTHLLCPESGCGHYSSTKEGLKDHVLHNPSGRPFQCLLCFQHFKKMQNLHDHCFVHTNEKPFECGHCGFATARRAKVIAHISSMHATIKFPFIAHLLDNRECLQCKVFLPTAEFLAHCEGHVDPVVIEA